MGTITLGIVSVFFLVLTEAQNMTSPTDIINSMKTTFEAAGAGGLKLGPMGLFGDMNGQFGVKVNKEQTSATAAAAHSKLASGGRLRTEFRQRDERKSRSLVQGSENSISKKDMKSCGGRYGRPVIIPIIVSTTTAATTTTTAAAGK